MFEGFIEIPNQTTSLRQYSLGIQLQQPNQLKGICILTEDELSEMLDPYKEIIKQVSLFLGFWNLNSSLINKRIAQSENLKHFLVEFKDILEKLSHKSDQKTMNPSSLFYSTLIHQIDQIGWEQLFQVDSTLSKITLQIL